MITKKRKFDVLDDLLCGSDSDCKNSLDVGPLADLVNPLSGTIIDSTKNRTKASALHPKPAGKKAEGLGVLITSNNKMLAILTQVAAISQTREPVLITGETGVGKELFVNRIHTQSGVSGHLVPVDIAGIDHRIFTETIFGNGKRTFPCVNTTQSGIIAKAANGTLFLDEIGVLNFSSQLKLLRLIQEGEYLPFGQNKPERTNARIITVTNHDLWALQRAGRFRKDLNFRLRTHHIHIPPLRERLDDLPQLIDYFMAEAAKSLGRKKPAQPVSLIPMLKSYSFPGNVRELKGMIFDAVSRQKGRVLAITPFKDHINEAKKQQSLIEFIQSDINRINPGYGMQQRGNSIKTYPKRKTTHYLSPEVFDGLNDIKIRIQQLLPRGEKLHISKSQITDYALRLILAEFAAKEKESLLVKGITAMRKKG